MAATITSKRTVFQSIAEHPDYHWPYYRLPDTEYTATDLGALEHDVHRLASAWFKQDAHDDVEALTRSEISFASQKSLISGDVHLLVSTALSRFRAV
jgi:hypothetical protein